MSSVQTLVVKIGTSSLTGTSTGQFALSTLAALVETLCTLRQQGHQVVLVSSGAVGIGCRRLNLAERPKTLAMKQAVAAVGQGRLMRIYDDLFSALNQPIAQVLLTRSDLAQRSRYVNSYRTFRQLLQMGVIPIVNENDTVAVEELKFGDNDTLSALVASLIGAQWLFLLTDVDRLYSADPRSNPEAQPIIAIDRLADIQALKAVAGGQGSAWGTGGMLTKLEAAQIATTAGVRTVITDGRQPQNVIKAIAGEAVGTQFAPSPRPSRARKRWIAAGLAPSGRLYLDQGATLAILQGGKSLLAAGITRLEGDFEAQDAVLICAASGEDIARGIINYSARDLSQILGRRSEDIPAILGYAGADTVIHRDNLVIATDTEADEGSDLQD
ncbi:glutamate 5-kinase [Nodosilinea sp. FACHB-13]|uniref:glutamate 5-kinase n=1 Tax=Cyanophyceae TaxID=3028117 RepID=UPI0016831F9F|nr:glutamate 5-kinase [Nodosilinea sp. FACHB-13]